MTAVRESLGMFISVENSLKMEPKVAKVSAGWLSYSRVCIAFFCVEKVKKIVTVVKR